MKNFSKAVTFFGTAAAALLLGIWTLLAVKTWAYMFIPLKASWALGAAAAFLPAVLLNKLLTRSYSRIEADSSELNSIFGMLLAVNIVVVPAIWMGIGGAAGTIAINETGRQISETLGVIEPVDEATLETFPVSDTGTGFVWVPNLGTQERPRVVARMNDGRLRAVYLPPRGETYTDAKSDAMVGPVDGSQVMLVPIPSDPAETRRVSVKWSGGEAIFEMRPNSRNATFHDRIR